MLSVTDSDSDALFGEKRERRCGDMNTGVLEN